MFWLLVTSCESIWICTTWFLRKWNTSFIIVFYMFDDWKKTKLRDDYIIFMMVYRTLIICRWNRVAQAADQPYRLLQIWRRWLWVQRLMAPFYVHRAGTRWWGSNQQSVSLVEQGLFPFLLDRTPLGSSTSLLLLLLLCTKKKKNLILNNIVF